MHAPSIQTAIGVGYGLTATLLFTVPQLVGAVVEARLFLVAERRPPKWFIAGGLFALGACLLVAGLVPATWAILAALALSAPANGCASGIAQAVLVDAAPEDRHRTMTRWTMMGALGDAAAPALCAGIAALGLGWRWAFVVAGGVVTLHALVLSRARFPDHPPALDDEDAPDGSLREAFRAVLRNRTLLVWLTACLLCALLDEILVAFAALYMRDVIGIDGAGRGLVLTAFGIGAWVGLLATERLLARRAPMRILAFSAAGCAAAFIAWLCTRSVAAGAAAMAAVGAFTAPLYPLVKAQAYLASPERSALVNAGGQLFTPLELALPIALGWIADAAGLRVALALLLVQPVWLLVLAVRARPGRKHAR